jgi:DNA-binding Lrp family transcriptional regulator
MDQITSNTIMVKQLNAELVKAVLTGLEYGTKLTIANATGLSVATCGNILNELLERGEVIEIDAEESKGGRPARRFVYNAGFCHVACLYVCLESGKYHLRYTVVNLLGEKLEESMAEYETIDVDIIDSFIEKLMEKYPLIKAVGIGLSGVICGGVVIENCDIEKLMHIPLEENLKKKYKIEFVIENDMNLKALGFYKSQKYAEDKNIAVVNIPAQDCVGAGLIIDGHVTKGNTYFAGEVSYLPFVKEKEINYKKDHFGVISLVIKTVISIVAIINPHTIALTGDSLNPGMIEEIWLGCIKVIPKEHMPQILLREHIHEDYMNGLISVTLESLTCDMQLVRKKF